jgi:putative oxidoreductase
MKINYALVSRALIALLFVVAGINKIMNFSDPINGSVAYVASLGVPMATLATILVIVIEIPVALMFVFCPKKICWTGGALIGITLLATILAHNPWAANVDPMAFKNVLTAALKNIAIIGGIAASIVACECENCKVRNSK